MRPNNKNKPRHSETFWEDECGGKSRRNLLIKGLSQRSSLRLFQTALQSDEGSCFVFFDLKRVALSILLFSISLISMGQEDEEEKKLLVNGYIKDMVTFTFIEGVDSALTENLIHNRINFQWFPSEKLTGKLEIRNRVFTGDLVKTVPDYADLLDVNNDHFDMSFTTKSDKVILQSMIDRAYLQWNEEKWQLSVGRQRINWGVNLAWNPNDIFNAYSLLDFDYEERPGSDAIRYQRFIGYAGGYEFAVKMADNWEELTAAGMYKWNVGSYDLQAIGGVMQNNAVLGGAWAGNIGLTGFKGEFTYFNSLDSGKGNAFLTSITSDYSFPNSLYLNGSILYNSYNNNVGGLGFSSTANLDVRSISSTKWSAYLQSSYPFHPLLNGSLMVLFFPGDEGVLFGPSLTYSPVTNFDFDLISQLFFDKNQPDAYLVYGRLKWSF